MFKKIIVPMALDHGLASRALDVAEILRSDDGEIVALHVIEPIPRSIQQYVSAQQKREVERDVRNLVIERIGDRQHTTPVIITGQVGWAITEYADKIGADSIVISSHKPELQDILLGSTTARVVHHANCTVHVIR